MIEMNDQLRRAMHRPPALRQPGASQIQCEFAKESPAQDRCPRRATRKWGDNWVCDEHGSRQPASPPVASEPAAEKPKAKVVGLGKPRGRKGMNKTEAAFALILEARKRAGEILRYEREGLTLRWPDGMVYNPDFVTWEADEHGTPCLTMIETKGAFIEGDALVKFRAARAHWPEFHFKMMQLKKGSWTKIL